MQNNQKQLAELAIREYPDRPVTRPVELRVLGKSSIWSLREITIDFPLRLASVGEVRANRRQSR
jgi:hypothetical protein